MRRISPVALILIVAFLGTGATMRDADAQSMGSSRWRPEDRVLLTDFRFVTGLARSSDRLFAATLGGLVIYDEAFRRFDPPITVEDGYPVEPVTAMVFDPRDGGVWMATATRRMLQFDPGGMRFRDQFPIGVVVRDIIPADRVGRDLFVLTDRGWMRLDTFSRRLSPASPEQVRAARDADATLRAREELVTDPGFQTVSSFIGKAGSQPVRVTDVMPSRVLNTYWIGTDGGFVYQYDHMLREWRPMFFGPLGVGAAALSAGPGGLWVAPREPSRGRYGVSRLSADLQSWLTWASDSSRNVPGPLIADMVATEAGMWAGGTEGLFRFDFESAQWARVATGQLPSRVVLSLAAAGDDGGPDEGIWVGTDRGLARVSATGVVLAAVTTLGRPTLAIQPHGGGLWVGTPAGLFFVDLVDGGGTAAAGKTGPFQRPTAALAASGDSVFAGLGAEVWSWSPGSEWARVNAVGRLGGPVTALAVADGVLWAGSSEELIRYDAARGEVDRFAFASGDLPGLAVRGIFDILPIGDREAWLALPAGALRIRIR